MARHSTLLTPLLAMVLGSGWTLPNAANTYAFAGPPTALAFLDQFTEVYLERPFDVHVAIVAYPEPGTFQTVVDEGTTAMVTLSIGSSPVAGATIACASGLTLATETTGTEAGTVTFRGCTIDQLGEGYRLRAVASSVVSTTMPAPMLADAASFFFRVAPAIEAPLDTVSISLTNSGDYPAVIWGDTVTVRVRFTVNGADRAFQLQQTTRLMTTWSKLADLVTDANGNATFSYRPSVSANLRVVFPGAPDLPAGTSGMRGFLLYSYAKQVPTHLTPKVIRRGTTVTFATTVRPILPDLAPARVYYSIYHRVSGQWKLASSRVVTVDSMGVARLPLKFGARGEWYVRSVVAARWTPGPEFSAPATAWASRPTPIARYSVR